MNIGLIECDPVIVAGTPAQFRVHLEPNDARDTVVRLTLATGISIGRFALALTDGTRLACTVRRKGSQYSVRCGPIRHPATLTAELLADAPVTSDRGSVAVAVNERAAVVDVRLEGRPSFVAERCTIAMEPNPVEPGQAFQLCAALFNDGTAACEGELHLRLPDGVFVPSPPSGAWWSLDDRERRILVVPTGVLPVADSVDVVLAMQLDGAAGEANEITIETYLAAQEGIFALDAAVVAVRSHASVEVLATFCEPARTFRYGDRTEIALRVRGTGNDAARGVVVRLPEDFIQWDASVEGRGMRLELGTILPGSEATIVCTGRVIASPPGREQPQLEPAAFAAYGDVHVSAASCTVMGEARLEARGFVEDVDARGCHEVRVVLGNVGDGDAPSLQLGTVRVPGVRGIVDSLAVDGVPVYEPDGSLTIEASSGLTLGPVGIRTTRTITWLVRAEKAGTYAIPLWLKHAETERHAEIVAQLADGRHREVLVPARVEERSPEPQTAFATPDDPVDTADEPLVSDNLTGRDDEGPSHSQGVSTAGFVLEEDDAYDDPALPPGQVEFMSEGVFVATPAPCAADDGCANADADPNDRTALNDRTDVRKYTDAREDANAGEHTDARESDNAEPATRLVHGLDGHTRATWTTLFPASPAEQEPLGRYVLAARAFLPRDITGVPPGVAALLLGLRSEIEAVHEAIARSSRAAHEFAPSGFDFGTAPLRATIRSLADTFGIDCDDLEGVGLERALVALIGAPAGECEACVREFREALARAVEQCRTLSDFGERAPEDVIAAARLVHDRVLAVPPAFV